MQNDEDDGDGELRLGESLAPDRPVDVTGAPARARRAARRAARFRRSPTTAFCPIARPWPCRPRRQRRVDVPAAGRLAERVRLDARPRRRLVPDRAHGRVGPGLAALPAGHDGPGDELEHRRGLGHRPRRAADRQLASRTRALPHPPPRPDRLRRRPRAAAHGPLRQRRGRDHARLRAGARLRPPAGAVGVHQRRLPRGQGDRRRLGRRAAPDHRPAPRLRGGAGEGAPPDEGGRAGLLRAVLVRARAASDLRRGLQAPGVDRPPLAALARPRRLPRPPVAHVPAAQRAHAQGAHLRPHRAR